MVDRLGEIFGVPVYETPVGFKYIGPKMMETNAVIGGEESGGFGFRGHLPERDGVVAGLFLLDLMIKLNRPMSEVIRYLQDKVGAFYYDRIDYHFAPELKPGMIERFSSPPAKIDGLAVVRTRTDDGFKYFLEDGSWLLVRFSGTEPILRVYTETTSADRVARILEEGRKMAGL
jgi:phosphomannomutase